MISSSESWQLSFCAGYIVAPCKRLGPDAIRDRVRGATVSLDSEIASYFLPLFVSSEGYPIDITFAPHDGEQRNDVRTLVRSIAFNDADSRSLATLELAKRLALATDERSKTGLFIVLSGLSGESSRVLLWKFPSDESLQATFRDEGLTIRLIQDAFSKQSKYFKAAMFEGTLASTSFWKGKVEDKQAKQRVKEVSDFWVIAFLAARPALTDVRGTKILARALRATIREADLEEKESLIASAIVIRSQPDRHISLAEFADNYLSEDIRPVFLKEVGEPEVAKAIFRIHRDTLESELGVKTIVLDNLFSVRGPLERFDDVVSVEPVEEDGIVEVSLRGRITSEKVGTRRQSVRR
jgi:hypothetical protein